MVRYGMVMYGTVWYGMVRYVMVWYGIPGPRNPPTGYKSWPGHTTLSQVSPSPSPTKPCATFKLTKTKTQTKLDASTNHTKKPTSEVATEKVSVVAAMNHEGPTKLRYVAAEHVIGLLPSTTPFYPLLPSTTLHYYPTSTTMYHVPCTM